MLTDLSAVVRPLASRRGGLRGISLALLLAVAPVACEGTGTPDTPEGAQSTGTAEVTPVILDIQHSGRRLQVEVNGVPLDPIDGEFGTHLSRITHFLVHGPNQVEITWSRAEGTLQPLRVEILAWPSGSQREDATLLASFEQGVGDPSGESGQRTLGFDYELDMEWAWQRGDPITALGEEDRSAILDRVRELHGAFAEGSVDGVMELVSLPLSEMAPGRPEVIESTRARYAEVMASPEWRVAPLAGTEASVEAYGRLVRVSGDGPLIESADLGGGTRIRVGSLYFSRIDGVWTLVLMT